MSSLMIVSAALTNSVAKFPCVTTTPPINGISSLDEGSEGAGERETRRCNFVLSRSPALSLPRSLLHVPMRHARMLLVAVEMFTDLVRDGHRAMSASGTPDRDGDVALSLALVERHQEIEQFAESANGLPRLLALIQVFDDRLIVAGQVFQFGDEMRVGQETHVEDQVSVQRDPVFEPEADDRDLGFARRVLRRETVPQPRAQRVDGVIGGVNYDVGQGADRFELRARRADRLDYAPGAEGVRPPRFTVAALQRGVARLHKEDCRFDVVAAVELRVDLRKTF